MAAPEAPSATRSLWLATTPETSYPALAGGLEVDVAVVGAGIAGVTAAHMLKRRGKTVALIDSRRIVHGATGYTTAKVTVAHGLSYSSIARGLGRDAARLYAEANQAGLDLIVKTVAEEGIECELERKTNFVYAETASERDRVEREVGAANEAGLAARLVEDVGLPYPVECAVALDEQLQFHPRKYLLPLAAGIEGDGSRVLELTRVLRVRGAGPVQVETDRGTILARDVILASQLPFADRGLFFAKAHPQRSYAVAARSDGAQDLQGMYINIGSPTRSIRTASDEDGPLLILGGEGHRTGAEPDTHARYRALEAFGRRHWGAEEFPYRWSTQDYAPLDGVPYVGRLTRREAHVLVATGFKKWGMTNGTAAAMILADLVTGESNPWVGLFRSKRLRLRASTAAFVRENTRVARHFVGDRLRRGELLELDQLAAGEGRLLRVDGHKTAAYRGEDGVLRLLSPVCTHLGCHVTWNPAESSWDCPCHGSRFAGDGTLIQGPATRDLERR